MKIKKDWAPFMDATGAHAGALLEMFVTTSYQSGGLEPGT